MSPYALESTGSQPPFDDVPPEIRAEFRFVAEGKAVFPRDLLRSAISAVHSGCSPLGEWEPFDASAYPAPLTLLDSSDAGELFLVHAGDGRCTPHLAVVRQDGFESVTLFATTPMSPAIVVAHELALGEWIADRLADAGSSRGRRRSPYSRRAAR